jgi:RNA polymerase sigma factor (sigma-70 family)
MNLSSEELRQLTNRAKQKDPKALNDLFGFLRQYVEIIVNTRGYRDDLQTYVDVDDVVQDVCSEAFQYLPTFGRYNNSKVTTWIYPMIRHACWRLSRNRSRTPPEEFAGVSKPENQLESILQRERLYLIDKLLGKIKPRYAALIERRIGDGYTWKQLANIYHTSKKEIYKEFRKAKYHLKRAVADIEPDYRNLL